MTQIIPHPDLKEFEIEFDIPLHFSATEDVTRRSYHTAEPTGEALIVPVVLDAQTVIQLDHLKVAGTPWGRGVDLPVLGDDASKTFTRDTHGWSFSAEVNLQTGQIEPSEKSALVKIWLNELAAVYKIEVSGYGSMDAILRDNSRVEKTVTSIAYVVLHP